MPGQFGQVPANEGERSYRPCPPAASVTRWVAASIAARRCSPITAWTCRSSLSSWDRRMRKLTGCPMAVWIKLPEGTPDENH